MNVMALLARNFVRQNRWLLLAFVLWPFLLGAFEWSPHHAADPETVAGLLKQEIFYGVVVVQFLASSAIYNEKRSRRIVGVLSKAVSRAEYLVGLLLACGVFAVIYFGAVAASLIWLVRYSTPLLIECGALMVNAVCAVLWTGSLALLFSTLLHPIAAASFAGAAAFAPFAVSNPNVMLAPAAHLMEAAGSFAATVPWNALMAAACESVAFLVCATQVFSSRDITVSIE